VNQEYDFYEVWYNKLVNSHLTFVSADKGLNAAVVSEKLMIENPNNYQ
jgi:hypothetical protein